jgi:predicted lipoprotein with Yx(FWY)xxD motif
MQAHDRFRLDRRLFAALAVALTIGACGGSGSGSGSKSATSTSGATVAVKQVDGVGKVLVAANGMALYTPAQEASGKILCSGACATVWEPLTPGAAAKPIASGNVGTLAVLKRPDGTLQVTANGRPLYTFAQDPAGQLTGNGVADAFGSQRFTWHAVLAGGMPASGSATSSSGSSSGGSSGGSGGYGY